MDNHPPSFISLIVCTYNRAEKLRSLLDCLTLQTCPQAEFEIIVVVDGSTDASESVCREALSQLPNLKYIILPQNEGFGNAANQALTVTKGEGIIFTDDDCLPQKDWVCNMRQALAVHEIVAGAVDTPSDNYLMTCANVSEFHLFMEKREMGVVPFIAGANMGLRMEVLRALEGFASGFIIPDMDLILRARNMGYDVYFHPECRIVHVPSRGDLQDELRHVSRYSAVTVQLRNQYHKLLHTPFFIRNRWWLLLFSPAIAIGKTFQIFFLSLGMIRWLYTLPVVLLMKFVWCIGAFKGLTFMASHPRK